MLIPIETGLEILGSRHITRFYPSENPFLPIRTHNFLQNPLFQNPFLPVGQPVFTRREPVFTRRAKVGFQYPVPGHS